MQSARFYGIHDVRFEEIEKPECPPDEVLVRVAWAGICGSDFHIYNQGMFVQKIPETMGHEFSGSVAEVGPEAGDDFHPGDPVAGDPRVLCGHCDGCRSGLGNTCENLGFIGEVRPGCFAEYISLPPQMLVKLPPGTDLRQAALAEPLAVALNTCERLDPRSDESVLIMGAGPIALLVIQVLKQKYGVTRIAVCGRSKMRLELAEQLGADAYSQLPKGLRFTAAIEAAGNRHTFGAAMNHMLPNGRIAVVSIFEDEASADLNSLVAKQITLIGANAYEHRHVEEAGLAIGRGTIDVSPVITKEYPLTECAEAFEFLNQKEKKAAKVLFRAQEE